MEQQRTASEIAALVQKRVQERDNWKVDGVVPPTKQPSFTQGLNVMKLMASYQPPTQEVLDKIFPIQDMNWDRLRQKVADDVFQITWIGHASLLVQTSAGNILTDPVFSDRCAPTQWLGPKRYRRPACSVQDLCSNLSIDLVLISHNHYDHLDYQSVVDICKYAPKAQFVVPLGLKDWFRSYVTDDAVIHELDWHESTEWTGTSAGLKITAVPMRHWSNRHVDRDKTLWCGYCVEQTAASKHRFLFPGDTAWFDALEDIGKQYGPFEVAAIPIGAYEPRDFMKFYHINVDEAVRMKDAINAKNAVPIHYGTFPLTCEPVLEPAEKLAELMKGRQDADSFVHWLIGETKVF